MQWERIPKSEIIKCPECGGTHIRIQTQIDQYWEQIGNRKTIEPTCEDSSGNAIYTCEACDFAWGDI